MPDKLLPVHIVARRLAVSRNTVYRLINAGELKAVNVGIGYFRQQMRVFESAVNDFLNKKESEDEA